MRRYYPILLIGLTLITTAFHACGNTLPFYFGMSARIGQNKLNVSEAISLYSLGMFNSIREESYWHRIEREKGQLVFPISLNDLDAVISRVKGAGGHPLIALDYSNVFYDSGDIPTTANGIEGFARYAKFTATHYKGRVPLYEVWNEWNIGLGSNQKPRTIRSVENYIRLLRPTIEAVRSVDPQAKLIAGAVAGLDDKWIDEFISLGGLKGVDGFSVHPYVYQRPADQNRPEDAYEWLARLSSKLTAANQGKPMDIYVTEIGWPNHQGKTGWTENQTADFVLRFFMLARSQPTIRGVWWHELRNSGHDLFEKEHNFGLLNKDLGVKPAFNAFRAAASLLFSESIVRIDSPSKQIFRAQIDSKQEHCSAYWTREGQASYVIPSSDLSGRLVWGSRPEVKELHSSTAINVNETPLITCRARP